MRVRILGTGGAKADLARDRLGTKAEPWPVPETEGWG
jgi:hypothetical protein